MKDKIIHFFQNYDAIFSAIVTLVIIVAFKYFKLETLLETHLDQSWDSILVLYSTMASASASILGFIITAVTVIISFGKMLKPLAEEDLFNDLFGVYKYTMFWLVLTSVLSFSAILIGKVKSLEVYFAYTFFGLAIIVLSRIFLSVHFLMVLAENFGFLLKKNPPTETDPD